MTRSAASRWRRHELPLGGGVVHEARSRAGAQVLVAPLPGVLRTHAMVAARFGSVDDHLPDGTPLPPGTAHLLEHQITNELFHVGARRRHTRLQ